MQDQQLFDVRMCDDAFLAPYAPSLPGLLTETFSTSCVKGGEASRLGSRDLPYITHRPRSGPRRGTDYAGSTSAAFEAASSAFGALVTTVRPAAMTHRTAAIVYAGPNEPQRFLAKPAK